MTDQLTIVIITYNRYPFLLRLLNFYDMYPQTFQILILDSSSDVMDHQELKGYFTQKHITHKKFDSKIFFIDKIARGCEQIKTGYAVLCADDDFLNPTALVPCVEFLAVNKDYASAHGLYFNHSNGEKTRRSTFTIGPLNKAHSSDNKTATKRVLAYLSGKTGSYPMYAIHRRETFELIWSESVKYVSDWGLSELFPCCLSFAYGNMKVLPIFYASREPNNFTWYDEERHKKMYSDEKLEKAVDGLSKHLSNVDKISLDDARNFALDAFNVYLNRAFTKTASHKNNKFLKAWMSLRRKVGIRTRLRLLFLGGCHSSIYPKYLADYNNLKQAVVSSDIPKDELNKSRKQYALHRGHCRDC
jgi:glycosyltransferase domain-containing protein